MQAFLTLAERQFIIGSELDGLRAQRDLRIPGLPDNYTLHHRDNICECCHCRVHVCSDKRLHRGGEHPAERADRLLCVSLQGRS